MAGARGLGAHNELATSYLTVLFREEYLTLLTRAAAQVAQGTSSGGGAAQPPPAAVGPVPFLSPAPDPNSLYLRATGNALKVMDRVGELEVTPSPPSVPGSPLASLVIPTSPSALTRSKVFTLLTQATSDENNSRMPPAWHPWF